MREVLREYQTEMAERDLHMSYEVLEIACGVSRGQAMILLADEEKRRKKRSRR